MAARQQNDGLTEVEVEVVREVWCWGGHGILGAGEHIARGQGARTVPQSCEIGAHRPSCKPSKTPVWVGIMGKNGVGYGIYAHLDLSGRNGGHRAWRLMTGSNPVLGARAVWANIKWPSPRAQHWSCY